MKKRIPFVHLECRVEDLVEGSLNRAVDYLSMYLSKHPDTDLEFDVVESTPFESEYIQARLVTYTLETDEQYAERIKREKLEKDERYKLYLQLKCEFER